MTETKYRKGDVVTVHGFIADPSNGLAVFVGNVRVPVTPEQIDMHEPRAIQVGDMVTCESAPCGHAVLAIAGRYAWIDLPGFPVTMDIKHLTPCDAPT